MKLKFRVPVVVAVGMLPRPGKIAIGVKATRRVGIQLEGSDDAILPLRYQIKKAVKQRNEAMSKGSETAE